MELGSDGSGKSEQVSKCGEASDAPSGGGGQGTISDGKRGNNSKTIIVNRIPTHVLGTLYRLFLIPTATIPLDITLLF